ncbi:MAG: sensor histidine kinase [Lachnospiraceae bacterium]|nr:sensor histidine kinase [Lachnospiraceae bacterium]
MKFSSFLKDRAIAYIIRTVLLAVCMIFLMALKVGTSAVIVVLVTFVTAAVTVDLWDYSRKNKFYNRFVNSLNDMDKKYLITEVVDRPAFYEGQILYDSLTDCDKSMAENVALYRSQSKHFREYIEMWVHEIKIPVASLRLMCHNNPETDKKMSGEIKRIDDYIENVLYYSRSENAEKDYIIKEISLQKAFGSVAVKNREMLQLMDATLDVKGLDVPVLTDGKWLEYMIGQLMSNSIKYRSKKRPLMINAYAEDMDDRVVFHFRDNGIGITERDIPYVFEKSFTGSNGRKDNKSTGMGLYIVKSLCDRLGHNIDASSKEGEFTEFRIAFLKNDYFKMS